MARRRNRNRNKTLGQVVPQKPPASTPVQGQLTIDDSATGTALEVLLARMAQIESAIRMELAQQRAMTESTTELIAGVRKELAEEKARSREAMEATRRELLKLYEKRPNDPQTVEAIIQTAMQDSRAKITKKRQSIKRRIEEAPKGTILNLSERVIPIGIHGFMFDVQPGRNENVPTPFVEAWEALQVVVAHTNKQNKALEGAEHSFGSLETLKAGFGGKDANEIAFNTETGKFTRR
jgi:hypothetical protein